MIRSSKKITDLDSAVEFAKITAAKGTDSLMGAANNIKGIAHELIYVKTENEDGDTVFAFMPEDTSHPQFDVLITNTATGEQKWEQLKTTTNSEQINNWIEKYPGSEGSLSSQHAALTDALQGRRVCIAVDDCWYVFANDFLFEVRQSI